MADIVFYEKPGCIGNRQQQAMLRELGHRLEVRDLLSESWSAACLRAFFGNAPVPEWFNDSAPDIKSGVIDIHALDGDQALELMLGEPLLIRRPLLQFGDIRQAGVTAGPVLDVLGIYPDAGADLQTCPVAAADPSCGQPA